MHEVLVNRLGGLSLPRKSVIRLIDRPYMTLDVYRGRKTTMQQQQQILCIQFLTGNEALPYFNVLTIYIIVFIFYLNLNKKRLLTHKCQHELLSHLSCVMLTYFFFLF